MLPPCIGQPMVGRFLGLAELESELSLASQTLLQPGSQQGGRQLMVKPGLAPVWSGPKQAQLI